jgi:hypothetical protein
MLIQFRNISLIIFRDISLIFNFFYCILKVLEADDYKVGDDKVGRKTWTGSKRLYPKANVQYDQAKLEFTLQTILHSDRVTIREMEGMKGDSGDEFSDNSAQERTESPAATDEERTDIEEVGETDQERTDHIEGGTDKELGNEQSHPARSENNPTSDSKSSSSNEATNDKKSTSDSKPTSVSKSTNDDKSSNSNKSSIDSKPTIGDKSTSALINHLDGGKQLDVNKLTITELIAHSDQVNQYWKITLDSSGDVFVIVGLPRGGMNGGVSGLLGMDGSSTHPIFRYSNDPKGNTKNSGEKDEGSPVEEIHGNGRKGEHLLNKALVSELEKGLDVLEKSESAKACKRAVNDSKQRGTEAGKSEGKGAEAEKSEGQEAESGKSEGLGKAESGKSEGLGKGEAGNTKNLNTKKSEGKCPKGTGITEERRKGVEAELAKACDQDREDESAERTWVKKAQRLLLGVERELLMAEWDLVESKRAGKNEVG